MSHLGCLTFLHQQTNTDAPVIVFILQYTNVKGVEALYLMVFFGDFCGDTLALTTRMLTAGTVSTTTLNQQTKRPKDGICSLQLLP